MGENEKLGFTCEAVPFDFSTFNRFFGATTDWVDEGSSTVPKVPRDSLYPSMSPSPLKENTQVWNGSQPPSDIDYIGIDTSGKPIYKPNTSCGTIPQLSSTDAQRFASAKAEMDAMAVKYKPIADKLMQEVFESSQKPIELLSEETAQQIHKAFEDIRKTMNKDFPMAFPKRKARKHYKPKFTL